MTPELSLLSGRQILKVLLKAGFEHTRTDGDHAFLANKKTQRVTVVPLKKKYLKEHLAQLLDKLEYQEKNSKN